MSGRSRHRITARRAPPTRIPPIQHDPDLLQSFLSDAAHVPGGVAAGVVFPADENEVAAVIAESARVLRVTIVADRRRHAPRRCRAQHAAAQPDRRTA